MILKEMMIRCWEWGRAAGQATDEEKEAWWEEFGKELLEFFLKQQPAIDFPDDLTTRWLERISSAKHGERAGGEESPFRNLTSVESMVKWWEEEIRPDLILQ